jgi:hypothetical protein
MKKIVIIFVVILLPYIVVANDGDSAFLIIGSETQPGSINMGVLFSNESISVIVRNQQ